MEKDTLITEIKGVGEKTAALFHKLGIHTVGDVLLYYPKTYIRFPEWKRADEVTEGETAAVFGRLAGSPVVRKARSMQVTAASVREMGVSLHLVWFRMPYLKNSLHAGESYVFYGKVLRKNGTLTMEQPVVYSEDRKSTRLNSSHTLEQR